jgi:hypothetical protein
MDKEIDKPQCLDNILALKDLLIKILHILYMVSFMLEYIEQLFQEFLLGTGKRLYIIQCKILINPHFAPMTLVYCYHVLGWNEMTEFLTESLESDKTLLEHVQCTVYCQFIDA